MKIDGNNTSTKLLLEKLQASARKKKSKSGGHSHRSEANTKTDGVNHLVINNVLQLHEQGADLETLKRAFISTVLTNEFDQKLSPEQLLSMAESAIIAFTSDKNLNSKLDQLILDLTEVNSK
ncbi:hypothetical protein [Microbulbifer rhizosphaerae]|uniref:Uncharacterized protein n=1 Tax=Microbulbifer rhizosphaerae TaxID=1562603 RepID=A0A7W4ZA37_9GAMM|nr:hypothetical protein [Microbulbifer rhizosphaerae]MBB3060929.1 hypothetical protein [Microbulbifer rhizosphaerae]